MKTINLVLVLSVVLVTPVFAFEIRVVKQYEQGVLYRLDKLQRTRAPGLRLMVPGVDATPAMAVIGSTPN